VSKKIKAIVFDLGKTLVKIEYKPLITNLSLDGRYNEIELFKFLEGPAQEFEKGEINSESFYRVVEKELKLGISLEKFKFAWCSVATEYVDGMERLLKILNAKYPIYMLSNTNELHFEYIMRKFPVLNCMRDFFLSYEIGVMKPSDEIYLYMLKTLRLNSSEVILIDDKEENVTSAERLGIDAVRFTTADELIRVFKKKNIME
jgi:HAD superfamily hydrolase (TIGR01509 family)